MQVTTGGCQVVLLPSELVGLASPRYMIELCVRSCTMVVMLQGSNEGGLGGNNHFGCGVAIKIDQDKCDSLLKKVKKT